MTLRRNDNVALDSTWMHFIKSEGERGEILCEVGEAGEEKARMERAFFMS